MIPAFSKDWTLVATANGDPSLGIIGITEIKSGKLLLKRQFQRYEHSVHALVFSPDKAMLVTGGTEGRKGVDEVGAIRLWNLSDLLKRKQ